MNIVEAEDRVWSLHTDQMEAFSSPRYETVLVRDCTSQINIYSAN